MNRYSSTKYDVTVNITAHHEGYYLHKTLRAVLLGCEQANAANIRVQLNLHLDNPDTLTLEIANNFNKKHPSARLFINKFGELSASRNFLISVSQGKYILFVDGDDLFTPNFISKSYKLAEQYGRPAVFSAENIVKFSDSIDPIIFRTQSTVDKPIIKSAIFETNQYVSQNFVTASIYKEIAYQPNGDGYGYEDWHWNTRVIARGYEYFVTPDTTFFYRRKAGKASLVNQQLESRAAIRATPLFEPNMFKLLPHAHYSYSEALLKREAEIEVQKATIARKEKALPRALLLGFIGDSTYVYRALRKAYRILRIQAGNIKEFLESNASNKTQLNDSGISSAILVNDQPTQLGAFNLSTENRQEWTKLNAIEPIIRPSSEVLAPLRVQEYSFEHSLASTYFELCKLYGESGLDDIIFVPWLQHGGADLVMLKVAQTLSSAGRKVLFITTSGQESTWIYKAKQIDNVVVLESHIDLRDLNHLNLKLLVLRICQNWNVKSVSVMNSSIGFELLDTYGKLLKESAKLIVHNYALPVDAEDHLVEAFPAFFESAQWIDVVVTDSKNYAKELQNIYGLEETKLLDLPVSISNQIQPKTSAITKRILYANRIAREKRPMYAIEAVALLAEQGITMDMYGSIDAAYTDGVGFLSAIEEASNITYRGVYNDVSEINFDDYDICLIPSIYEGIPNIVLESIKAGLYIIASDVGGLNEVVVEGKNGTLIKELDNVENYKAAITQYYEDSSLQNIERRKLISEKIIKEHTTEHFEAIVSTIYEVGELHKATN